jgi:tRNA(Met) cytidine acetyltransferase
MLSDSRRPMSDVSLRHRRLMVLSGEPASTAAHALRLVGALPAERVLWVGSIAEADAGRLTVVPPRAVAAQLGRAFDAVVLDAHAGFDADVLGQSHGLVWGTGALILRRPPPDILPPPATGLGVFPHAAAEVGQRFERHVARALARAEQTDPHVISAVARITDGSDEQAAIVARLVEVLGERAPARVALLADRGRGKSSALGLAVGSLRRDLGASGGLSVAVTSAHPSAVAEVFRFATSDPTPARQGAIRFVSPMDLVTGDDAFDVVLVDEAAQLSVPLLRRIVRAHPRARLVFATTLHGYEGTGRGFSLRFLAELGRGPVPVQRLALREPIRWETGDPVERFAFDALLLDADLDDVDPSTFDPARLEASILDRDALAGDEEALRGVFGLLVVAHYRTTPSDLHRMLDAPNLAVHVLRHDGKIVAATLVAREGGLSAEFSDEVRSGRIRLRAHALADALVAHLGHADAGPMTMVRSVRIAVHPALRRRGLARRLVAHVHRSYAPDLFGTMFGAEAGLVAFRRRVGYELVRVSASRGASTGEPSTLMIRPVSARARALCTILREELARELPGQLRLLRAEALPLTAELEETLRAGLPEVPSWTPQQCRERTEAYAWGPRTFESCADAITRWVQAHPERLERIDARARALVQARVVQGQGWRAVAAAAGSTLPAAMRGLRRAFRDLLAAADPTG